uniref:Uncharacterized protein n=1 Tax=Sus scrofa TaxID=9823 RepID=A0A480FZA8_PIG
MDSIDHKRVSAFVSPTLFLARSLHTTVQRRPCLSSPGRSRFSIQDESFRSGSEAPLPLAQESSYSPCQSLSSNRLLWGCVHLNNFKALIPSCCEPLVIRTKNIFVPVFKSQRGVPVVVQWLTNLTRYHEVSGSIPGLTQWVKDLVLP